MVITVKPDGNTGASRIAMRLMMHGIDYEVKGNFLQATGDFEKVYRSVGVDGEIVDMVDYGLHSGEIQR